MSTSLFFFHFHCHNVQTSYTQQISKDQKDSLLVSGLGRYKLAPLAHVQRTFMPVVSVYLCNGLLIKAPIDALRQVD